MSKGGQVVVKMTLKRVKLPAIGLADTVKSVQGESISIL